MRKNKQEIKTTNGHCWLTFKNGYTISIFNGFGSYTDNHYNYKLASNKEECSSKDVEIAILYKDIFVTPNFIDCNGDEVKGYLSINELADIIYKVKNYKEEK